MNLRLLEKPVYFFLSIAIPAIILLKYSDQSVLVLFSVFAFALAGVIYLFNWDKYFAFALVTTVLFSVDVSIVGETNLAIPSEPLATLLAFSSIYSLVLDKAWRARLSVLFPIKILMLFALVFLVIGYFSSMPKVTYKYIAIWVIYALSALNFARLLHYKEINFQTLLKIWAISLTLVGLFSIYNLLPYNFNPGAAPIMAKPFFKDHTVFSATLALFAPLYLFCPKHNSKVEYSYFKAVGVFLVFVIFISSSRAAWLSLILSFSMYGILRYKVKSAYLVAVSILALAVVFVFQKDIQTAFLVNPYQSSNVSSSIEEQALSVTNLSSDPSNMERLNRWKCAWRMFEEKPITGYGPGTYQFQYLPFQRQEDMTYISVTSPFLNKLGRGGSAHSEYFLLLSESGIFSFILWLMFLGWIVYATFRNVRQEGLTHHNYMLVAVFLGLFTYMIHALFNNYLNVAVFGIPFWILTFVFIYLKSISSHAES